MSEILTDRLVARLDEDSKRFPEYMRTLLNGQVERLCASHRLLSARVKELEERASFAEAFLPKGHLHD